MESELKRLKKRIGIRVEKLRLRGKQSREKLAAVAGISSATVLNIENAETNPTLDVLDRIATALGVKVEALVKS